ncbi:hypothetical protein E4T42_00655 [Aureobasidium subglaciale]|nr:hypothetical protein E4T42_00655 [Aureobasidium subglaciale]
MLSLSTLLTSLIWALALSHFVEAAPASKPSCTSNDPALVAIKNDFGSPLAFCQWWSGASYIPSSPIDGVATADISRACKCINSNPALLGKATTTAMASSTGVSKVPNLDALRKLVAQPLPFCKFWFNAPVRKGSPFVALPAPVVSQVCKVVTATPALVTSTSKSTKAASTSKKTPSSSSSTTRISSSTKAPSSSVATTANAAPTSKVSSSSTRSTIPSSKPAISSVKSVVKSSSLTSSSSSSTLSLASSSSSTLTSVVSALPTPVAEGTVFTASEVTLPPAPTASLGAIAPPGLDLNNVENLTPAPQADLYFAGSHNDDNSTTSVAKVGVAFQHPSVVLDHTSYIKSVHCDSSSITIVFNDLSAYQHSKTEWQIDGHLILVTSEDSCGANGTSTMFITQSFTFDASNLIAVGAGKEAKLADIFDTFDMDFGTITTSNTSAPSCGPMNGTTDGFPSAACGDSFDATIDQELGYYSGDASDAESVLAAIAPTSQTTLSKRGKSKSSLLGSLVSGAKKVASSAVKTLAAPVAKAAEKLLPPAIVKAGKDTLSTLKSATSAALSFIPPITLSKSLTVPFNLGPAQNDPSPWGMQYKFFEYSPDAKKDASMIAATQKSLNSMSKSLNGVSNPRPGIQMFCVDCGIKGTFQTVGTVSASAAKGVTRCDVSLTGNLYAGVFVGVNAFAAYEKNVDKNLLNKGLPSLSIPGVAVIGPKLTVAINSNLKVQAAGQMLVGASMNWPSINAKLDLLDKSKSTQSGFTPDITKKFDAFGDVTASASLSLPVTFFFGVDIMNGAYTKGVSLVDVPAVSASAELAIAASYGTGAANSVTSSTGCFGIKYGIDLSNDLSVHLLDVSTFTLNSYKKNLGSGCLGRAVPTVKRSSSSSAAPTSTEESTPDATSDAGTSTPTDDAGSSPSSGTDSGGSASTTVDSGDSPAPTDSSSQPTTSDSGLPDAGSTQADSGSAPTSSTVAGSAPTSNAGANSAQTTSNVVSSKPAVGSGAATTQQSSSTTTTTNTAPTPSALKCGDFYTADDGTYYQVQCGFDIPGHDIQHVPYSNLSSCIDACADYGSGCAGVIWVQRGQDAQNCWFKSSVSNKGSIPSGLTLFAATPVKYAPMASCPGADGTTFVDAQNQVYQIKCNTDLQGFDLGGLTGYTNMESCVNYCDGNIDCIGVSYAYSGTYKTPLCYPKYQITDMPLNTTRFRYKVDSAVKMNRPAKKALGSCPSIDGSTFYDKAGLYYSIKCGLDYEGNDIIQKDGVTTLEQCINACDATTGCTGVGFAHDGYYGNNPGCYLKSAQSSNPINSTTDLSYIVDSAFLISGLVKKRDVPVDVKVVSSSSTASALVSLSSTVSSRLVSSSAASSFLTSTSSILSSTSPTTSTKIPTSSPVTSTASLTLSSSSTMSRSSTSSSASSSASAVADNSTNIVITDTTFQLQLTSSDDGNLHMSPNFTAANFASDGVIALGDSDGDLFVYYPDMMSAYGASRFRLAGWGEIPHGARLLTLTPFKSGQTTVLMAVDTLGNFFFPVLCAFETAQQAKVFLVKDPTADLSFIADPALRFIMTGGVVKHDPEPEITITCAAEKLYRMIFNEKEREAHVSTLEVDRAPGVVSTSGSVDPGVCFTSMQQLLIPLNSTPAFTPPTAPVGLGITFQVTQQLVLPFHPGPRSTVSGNSSSSDMALPFNDDVEMKDHSLTPSAPTTLIFALRPSSVKISNPGLRPRAAVRTLESPWSFPLPRRYDSMSASLNEEQASSDMIEE